MENNERRVQGLPLKGKRRCEDWRRKNHKFKKKLNAYFKNAFKHGIPAWRHLTPTPPSCLPCPPSRSSPSTLLVADWLNHSRSMWVTSLLECSDRLVLPACVIFPLSLFASFKGRHSVCLTRWRGSQTRLASRAGSRLAGNEPECELKGINLFMMHD